MYSRSTGACPAIPDPLAGRHQAVVFRHRGDLQQSLRAWAWPSAEGGAGAVLAYVTDPSREALQGLLGGHADDVVWAPPPAGPTPARLFDQWMGHGRHLGGRASVVRVVLEPAVEAMDVLAFEAVIDHITPKLPIPTTVVCLFDERVLTPGQVEAVGKTHARLLEPYGPAPSGLYTPSAPAGRRTTPTPPERAHRIAFSQAQTVRGWLRGLAGKLLDDIAFAKLLTAVDAAASNAILHGGEPREARAWLTADAVVVQIIDVGFWRPDPFIGYLPPRALAGTSAREEPMGLWGIRVSVDHADIHGGPDGTTITLTQRLPDIGPHL